MEATEPTEDDFTAMLMEPVAPEETDEATDEAPDAPDLDEDQTDEAEADDEPEVDDEDEDDTDSEQPELYTVKVDGEEVQVTLDDLQRSFSGQKYIQKGMKEAAEARKQADAQIQAYQQQQQQLEQLVQYAQQGGFNAPIPPDMAMLQTDPIGYMEAKAHFDQRAAQYSQAMQQRQALQQQQQQQEQEADKAHLAEQRAALYEAIPELSDPDKGTALSRKIRDTALEVYGFNMDELQGLTDARMARTLHDAMRYQELMKGKDKATAKAVKARPVAKAGAKTDQKRSKQRAQLEKLKSTGSDEAAIALMFQG